MATHSSILAWEIPGTEEPGGPRAWDHKESDTTEPLSRFPLLRTWSSQGSFDWRLSRINLGGNTFLGHVCMCFTCNWLFLP